MKTYKLSEKQVKTLKYLTNKSKSSKYYKQVIITYIVYDTLNVEHMDKAYRVI